MGFLQIKKDVAIARTIIALGNGLGMKTIADFRCRNRRTKRVLKRGVMKFKVGFIQKL